VVDLKEKPNSLLYEKLHVSRQGGKMAARALVRAMAKKVGFDARAVEELVLVTSELAENLAVHAQKGEMVFKQLTHGSRRGIQIETRDRGPGICDIELALKDGYSTQNSLGYGLGTVNRLMDELEISSTCKYPAQTCLIAKRYIMPHKPKKIKPLSTFGAASRPLHGSKVNGDGFFIKEWANGAMVGVIDGLGHGQYAHRATQKTLNYLEDNFDKKMPQIFMGVNRQCLATRGVVMALARFSWDPGSITLAAIGNISLKTYGALEKMDLPVLRGVLGRAAPNPLVVKHPWSDRQGLIMHSDGLTSHWSFSDYPNMAKLLLDSLSKGHDDATILVVKGNAQ
jgi:anti-sigma regulatory factor (Ser/Thr protein kinase)